MTCLCLIVKGVHYAPNTSVDQVYEEVDYLIYQKKKIETADGGIDCSQCNEIYISIQI